MRIRALMSEEASSMWPAAAYLSHESDVLDERLRDLPLVERMAGVPDQMFLQKVPMGVRMRNGSRWCGHLGDGGGSDRLVDG